MSHTLVFNQQKFRIVLLICHCLTDKLNSNFGEVCTGSPYIPVISREKVNIVMLQASLCFRSILIILVYLT